MRWFQINKESLIFNLANITHFETAQLSGKWHVVAYFNFNDDDDYIGINGTSQHHSFIFSARKRKACEQVIKDIINGKYDVTHAASTPKR